MAFVVGIVAGKRFNKVFYDSPANINLQLNSNLEYYMAFDQSTTCTGIYLCPTDFSFHILIDFKKKEDNKSFFRELKIFVRRLVKDIKVKLVLTEKPVPSKFKTSGNTLRELKGRVAEWIDDFPAFEGAIVDDIFPQSWKTAMVDKSKGKGRFNIKSEVALDISDKFPEIKPYLAYHSAADDYDSFDACGILHGYLATRYSENGNKKIIGEIETSHHTTVFYKYIDANTINNTAEFWRGLELPKGNLGIQMLEYNPKFSMYQNIKMASSHNNFSLTLIAEPLNMLSVLWNFKLQPRPGYFIAMFILRSGKITKTQLKRIKEMVPCYDEFL